MDDELKHLLEEQLKISKESLSILKKLNRARQWAKFFGLLKWAVIIGLTIFGLVKIQPYLESLIQTTNSASDIIEQLNSFDVNKYLKQ